MGTRPVPACLQPETPVPPVPGGVAPPPPPLRVAWATARCATAGLFAALGPVVGRLASAGGDTSTLILGEGSVPHEAPASQGGAPFTAGLPPAVGLVTSVASLAPWARPLLCSLGVVLCNVAMWALYISGMDAISSLRATVLNSGSNIAFSGLLGHLVLGETVTARWMAGVACICGGLLLLTWGTQPQGGAPVPYSDKAKTE